MNVGFDFLRGLFLLCKFCSAFCDNKGQQLLVPTLENISIGHDHIKVTWNKPRAEKFYIKYRVVGESEWTIVEVPDTREFNVTLTNLLLSTR